jgi:SsrA-binding protein
MTFLENNRGLFDYEILDTYEGGLVLRGHEVKTLRKKQGSLHEAYLTCTPDGILLKHAHIPAYQPKNTSPAYDPYRPRTVLVTKKELHAVEKKIHEKGLTLIPLSLYNKNNLVKVRFALVRGKKKYDKRESIKKRDTLREVNRIVKTEFRG